MLLVPPKVEVILAWAKEPSNNIYIHNPDAVAAKLAAIDEAGAKSLHIVTDFDMTLTRYWVDGKRSVSTHGILEQSTKLTAEARQALTDLYKKYYPIEVSSTIPFPEKVAAMEDWWGTAHKIIASLGLTRDDIAAMVRESPVSFRPKLQEFLAVTAERDVPVLVFSAGLADVLQEIISSANLMHDNLDIVSNKMRFEDGVVVGFEDPLIHTFNKSEATVAHTAHHTRIDNRRNVIVMGDSLGDLRMADNIDCDVKLTIGLLNHDEETLIDQYAQAFDIVILKDSPLEFPLMLVSSLV
ncbi:pyrimidine 5'-nucleotidase [Entophlyctis helioformis]|nr:pyrimidine 5'-nucleotidase [Entophlyctis helioformis]